MEPLTALGRKAGEGVRPEAVQSCCLPEEGSRIVPNAVTAQLCCQRPAPSKSGSSGRAAHVWPIPPAWSAGTVGGRGPTSGAVGRGRRDPGEGEGASRREDSLGLVRGYVDEQGGLGARGAVGAAWGNSLNLPRSSASCSPRSPVLGVGVLARPAAWGSG